MIGKTRLSTARDSNNHLVHAPVVKSETSVALSDCYVCEVLILFSQPNQGCSKTHYFSMSYSQFYSFYF